MTRAIRLVTALALLAAGALLHAASWQRWAGACTWPFRADTDACTQRQDHLYDFMIVGEPWQPIGTAAEQAGLALMLVALAVLLAPWALLARPGPYLTSGLVVVALCYAMVGAATLGSGLSGQVVSPLLGEGGFTLWLLISLPVFVWAAARARGWARAAAVFLVLASPTAMFFGYAIGPYDAAPWYEAHCGDLTALAGICTLVAALRPARAAAASSATTPAAMEPVAP